MVWSPIPRSSRECLSLPPAPNPIRAVRPVMSTRRLSSGRQVLWNAAKTQTGEVRAFTPFGRRSGINRSWSGTSFG
jgi:hypothetical protein